ncbi:MAG: putative toxin-antitoxin system toxin component, PIN family [Burkholderiaceae bacterium]
MRVPCVVLDTNIVLDLLIFKDPRCAALRQALDNKAIYWIATQVMRDELERVLTYTHLQPRMAFYQISAEQVLAQFDAGVELNEVAARCRFVCTDEDDQKFIDLAAEYSATLVSKDKAVLRLRKRLATLGAVVLSEWSY